MAITTGNALHINGWVTPRLEKLLRRATEISTERGYNYLGVEHIALAMIEDPDALPMSIWDEAITVDQWRDLISANLPELPTEATIQPEPLTVVTTRNDPNYQQSGTD